MFIHSCYSPKSLAAIISICVLSVLSLNVVLGLVESINHPKTSAFQIAKSVHASIQFVWAWLMYA